MRLQYSRRACSEAINFRELIGRYFDQIPPGLRKSGMPDSVLIPAPVNTTPRLLLEQRPTGIGKGLDAIWMPKPHEIELLQTRRLNIIRPQRRLA